MFWIALTVACASIYSNTCNFSTTDRLFRDEEACNAYLAMDKIQETANHRRWQGICLSIETPADNNSSDDTEGRKAQISSFGSI